jgi:hypothetical protein
VIGYRSFLLVEMDGHREASPKLGVTNGSHLVFGEVRKRRGSSSKVLNALAVAVLGFSRSRLRLN